MDGWNGERQIGSVFADIEPKHLERYRIAAQYCKGKKVLDAACGIGYGSNILANEGNAVSVTGVDVSPEALEYGMKHWHLPEINFVQYDLNQRDFDLGVFDVIVSFETIEHLIPYPAETLEKFDALLEPGGYLIYSHPEMEPEPRGRHHLHSQIKGDEVIQWMEQYNYNKILDWKQPGRSPRFDYRIVILWKNNLCE